MIFNSYEIDNAVAAACISQDDHDNLANQITHGVSIKFCSYMKSVSGKQQIFVAYSTDDGETWTSEQVTTTAYDKYGSSCAVDTTGTGLHLTYTSKGYGATTDQRAHKSIVYQFRSAAGVWSTPVVIHQCENVSAVYREYTQPSIAVDADNKVHLVCSFRWNIGYFTNYFYVVYIIIWPVGVTSDLAWFLYGYLDTSATQHITQRPTIHLDSYGNPHVTFSCRRPNSSYALNCHTTCWVCNNQQGAWGGWPGTTWAGYQCYGVIPDGASSSLRHTLCDKSKTDLGGAYPTTHPSSFHGVSTCHVDGYFDDVNGYDYPHFVYNFDGTGGIYDAGTYYMWRDITGFHDELISASGTPSDDNSIALGPDGIIHTLVPSNIEDKYEYRQRATPASAWGDVVTVSSIWHPQQLAHIHPTQFPLAEALCSPFMAVDFSSGTVLKYFKCAGIVTGYGYFM